MLTPVVSIAHVMAFHDLEMLNFCFAWLLLAAKQKFSIPGSCGGSAAAGASAPGPLNGGGSGDTTEIKSEVSRLSFWVLSINSPPSKELAVLPLIA
ncbi:hypothetical protein JTE90_027470 [Oedothorax gibbosus]|uniref:Secreted protein n=1 Tax=Oedothorax gibbosus TaxID=931172 RepID=A0AAV6TI17_9ARAC|nr:hypothetical protein JTE90_027470 [Oedothorax gibbosus]